MPSVPVHPRHNLICLIRFALIRKSGMGILSHQVAHRGTDKVMNNYVSLQPSKGAHVVWQQPCVYPSGLVFTYTSSTIAETEDWMPGDATKAYASPLRIQIVGEP